MSEAPSFPEFIQRIRSGDAQAAAELLQHYEPVIRQAVHSRLGDQRLRRVFDSMDVCQSVLGDFFVRAAAGGYELNTPEQLVRLLTAMARYKLAFQARKQHAQRRDNRRQESLGTGELQVAAADPTPSRVVAGKELLRTVQDKFSAEERQLADLRAQGREWTEIAAELGGTPQARRKQLARAVTRIAHQLGLDSGTGE